MTTDAAPRTITLLAEPVAKLLADSICHLVQTSDDHEPCCPQCCTVCKALRALLDAGQLDDAVRPVALPYVWWQGRRLDGQVDRDWLEHRWQECTCDPDDGGEDER